jgi:hypothetical protein
LRSFHTALLLSRFTRNANNNQLIATYNFKTRHWRCAADSQQQSENGGEDREHPHSECSAMQLVKIQSLIFPGCYVYYTVPADELDHYPYRQPEHSNMWELQRDLYRHHSVYQLRPNSRSLFMLLLLLLGSPAYANDQSCRNYEELLKTDHMSLGVSLDDVTDPQIRQQFRQAMNFWATVLDMEWRRDETPNCAIKVTYGIPAIFDFDDIAQADDPDSDSFRGEIAFNATFPITPRDAYLVCIHEIGHLLGLDHNPSPDSVMHAVRLDGFQKLELTDISALSARHRLRWSNDAGQRVAFDFPLAIPMDHLSSATEQIGFSPPGQYPDYTS